MKTNIILTFLIFSICLVSCKQENTNEKKETAQIADTTEKESAKLPEKRVPKNDPRKKGAEKTKEQLAIEENNKKIGEQQNALCGYWVGSFGKNKINIALASVSDEKAYGHSVCAGNYRYIQGTVKKLNENTFEFEMSEPGDDQYDGRFNFVIDLNTKNLTGKWAPFKNTVKPKTYTLAKREFKYDPTLGDHAEASTRYLETGEVANLLPEEAEMIRNEVYARHGYSFQNMKMRRIFDEKDWYIPMCIDVRDLLTDIEAYNIDLLYNYENYQEEYYDDYGR